MVWKPDYATAAQLKGFLGIPAADVADDTELAGACTAASRAVDRATLRQFGQVTPVQLRTYTAAWDRHRPAPAWTVSIDDLQDITGLIVSVGGVAVSAPFYLLEPVNALDVGKPYTHLTLLTGAEALPTTTAPAVDITALWGWTAVPATILQATKLQAGRFFKRRQALFGVAGSPADGSELRLLERVDPDVRVMVTDYVRWWGAA